MKNYSISIIIVNYNVAGEIRDCLNSLDKFIGFEKLNIIVVDNNSQNRDIEKLIDEFPSVQFHLLKENLGFSGGNNFGFKFCNTEFVLFLNPDILLIEDCITPLINFFENNSNVGISSCLLLNEDKSLQSSFGGKRGILVEFVEAFYFLIPIFKAIKMYFIGLKIKKGIPFKVAWTSGAFILTKSSFYRDVGGFDKDYPLNYEDMDLCAKYFEKNLSIFIYPETKCIHLESRSQKRNYYRFVYSRYYGRLLYLHRHVNASKRTVIIILHILGLFFRLIFNSVFFNGTEKKERKEAVLDSLKLYLSPQKKP